MSDSKLVPNTPSPKNPYADPTTPALPVGSHLFASHRLESRRCNERVQQGTKDHGRRAAEHGRREKLRVAQEKSSARHEVEPLATKSNHRGEHNVSSQSEFPS
jgi:hypothetical protein